MAFRRRNQSAERQVKCIDPEIAAMAKEVRELTKGAEALSKEINYTLSVLTSISARVGNMPPEPIPRKEDW